VHEREPLIARIVVAELGDLGVLLRLIKRLKVRSLARVRIRYALAGIDAPRSSPVVRGAHYDETTGELFVQGDGLDVSWPELARCLKDALLQITGRR
jgi:hypothetical protein